MRKLSAFFALVVAMLAQSARADQPVTARWLRLGTAFSSNQCPSSQICLWTKNDGTLHFGYLGTDSALGNGGGTVPLTDAATINTDASLGAVFTVTLAGNRTLANPTNLSPGGTYMWIITQDGTGSRTLTYGTNFKWPSGTAPTLTTAAGSVDMVTAVYDGTKLRAVFNGDFR